MLLLATSAFQKAASLPGSFWMKVFLGIAGFLLLVYVVQKLAHVNKFLVAVVGIIAFAVMFGNWVYERNEPKFLTPFVDVLAEFLPTKGAYEVKQQSDPSKPGLKKNARPTPPPRH